MYERFLVRPVTPTAFLLQHYCHVSTDKRFQLADWRVRPLTAEMIAYARIDTHYLLYLYEVMKRALIEKNGGRTSLVETVWKNSQVRR